MKESEKIIHDYREALRGCYGDEIAEKSHLYHSRGWYYIELAQKFSDGSCGAISSLRGAPCYPKKKILAWTEELKRRCDFRASAPLLNNE